MSHRQLSVTALRRPQMLMVAMRAERTAVVQSPGLDGAFAASAHRSPPIPWNRCNATGLRRLDADRAVSRHRIDGAGAMPADALDSQGRVSRSRGSRAATQLVALIVPSQPTHSERKKASAAVVMAPYCSVEGQAIARKARVALTLRSLSGACGRVADRLLSGTGDILDGVDPREVAGRIWPKAARPFPAKTFLELRMSPKRGQPAPF